MIYNIIHSIKPCPLYYYSVCVMVAIFTEIYMVNGLLKLKLIIFCDQG